MGVKAAGPANHNQAGHEQLKQMLAHHVVTHATINSWPLEGLVILEPLFCGFKKTKLFHFSPSPEPLPLDLRQCTSAFRPPHPQNLESLTGPCVKYLSLTNETSNSFFHFFTLFRRIFFQTPSKKRVGKRKKKKKRQKIASPLTVLFVSICYL